MKRTTASVLCMMILLTVVLAGLSGCGKESGGSNNEGPPRKQVETVKPTEDDGAIYSTTEEFIKALVSDDREKVLSFLTKDHRSSWEDGSFLITGSAREKYREFALENLNYTVVKYMNDEETNFENVGMIFAVYDVVMKNEGEEKGRVKLQESLIFRKEDGRWLISLDERGFLVEKN